MRTLTVGLGERSYPIHIGRDLLASAGTLLGDAVRSRRVLVVTNDVVGPLYADALRAGLADTAADLHLLELPDGEAHKTLAAMARIIDALVEYRVGRDGCLVALGGGVTGDIAGFAAACYQRGMPWVQVPTTLLAQVDSSVGGKTGVNHPGGKNLIGAFYQPHAVLSDLSVLGTLQHRHYRAGLAEVVKYGLILDGAFFAWLEARVDALNARDPDVLAEAVERCCAIKASVVAQDEREHGDRRMLLNLGHTFGHGIEHALGYGDWLHGEAVAAGMVMAAQMSRRQGWLDEAAVARITHLLSATSLPVTPPPIGAARLLDAMRMDKKVRDGRLTLVLLRALGEAVVTADFDPDHLMQTLAAADR